MSSSRTHPADEPGATARSRTTGQQHYWNTSVNIANGTSVTDRRSKSKKFIKKNNQEGSSEEEEEDRVSGDIVSDDTNRGTDIGTIKNATELPPLTYDTSMEALNASRYIVSVVLVLVLGGLVGLLATVSHNIIRHRRHYHLTTTSNSNNEDNLSANYHHHHLRNHPRYHRHRDHRDYHLIRHYQFHLHRYHHYYHHRNRLQHQERETPASQQRRLLLLNDDRQPSQSASSMLTVSAGMEVGSGGHGGGLGGGLDAKPPAVQSMHQEAMVAVARDRAIRAGSVRHDLALDLPPRLQLPDGEERPYGAQAALHLRDPDQESEIYQKCVRPPPNRTIFDSESPPPYRSQSGLLDTQERIVRCHSAGSSLLRVFRKFPTSSSNNNNNNSNSNNINNNSGAVPTVVVPTVRRTTLSSYSDSSGNLSNLSSLTVVPCEADETSSHHQHHHHDQQNNENV